jgi:hypothetical protein
VEIALAVESGSALHLPAKIAEIPPAVSAEDLVQQGGGSVPKHQEALKTKAPPLGDPSQQHRASASNLQEALETKALTLGDPAQPYVGSALNLHSALRTKAPILHPVQKNQRAGGTAPALLQEVVALLESLKRRMTRTKAQASHEQEVAEALQDKHGKTAEASHDRDVAEALEGKNVKAAEGMPQLMRFLAA